MKKYIFFAILLSLILPVSVAMADNIVTGNASSETRVYNSVGDDGQTYTHIETTVNGQTHTIDSKNQGEIDVRNENGKVTVIKSPNVMVTITEGESSTPTPTLNEEHELKTPSLVTVMIKGIEDFFHRFFHAL
jgi:hypothetical protein